MNFNLSWNFSVHCPFQGTVHHLSLVSDTYFHSARFFHLGSIVKPSYWIEPSVPAALGNNGPRNVERCGWEFPGNTNNPGFFRCGELLE